MKRILSTILCSVLIFTLAGCERAEVKKDNDSKAIIEEAVKDEDKEVITKEPEVVKDEETKGEEIKTKEVVLYFSDDQAMYLMGEKRNIEDPTAKSIVLELIKGPTSESIATLPSDLKLLDVQVKEGLASVDFSGDSVQKISAGSSGEVMAFYSIINTLILDKSLGITKVQFLVDGKKVETIGQSDVSVPMIEDSEMIKK